MISDAFTQSEYAINITDPEGILLQVNEAYLRLYKIPDASLVLGKTQKVIRSPDTPASVYKDMWATIKAGGVWRGNLANRALDGSPVFIHLTISPVRREGRIVGYMGFSLDRFQQMILEQQLFHANKLVVLGTLGAGLAHELNNPLASILLDAEYLREAVAQIPGEEARKAALEASDSVIRGAERMRRVLEHLLMYSKKDSAATPSTIALGNLLQDSLLFLERQLRSRGIDIILDAGPDLYVTGNRTQLESVLHNLLGNSRDAFAAHEKPGKRISMRVEYLEEPGMAQIRYRDNAGGIPPAILDRVFEPFFTTKGGEGTGLGLSISRQVVQQHGGDIECVSEEGETEFRIRLPATFGDASKGGQAARERMQSA
jgi:PAS domain S-box-containing protein